MRTKNTKGQRLYLNCDVVHLNVESLKKKVLSTERLKKTDTGKCIAGQASTFSVCCFSGFTLIKFNTCFHYFCISVTTLIVSSRACTRDNFARSHSGKERQATTPFLHRIF